MGDREGAVFLSSIRELKEVLTSERLSNEVANHLYQSKGIISMDDVKDIRTIVEEEDRANTLLTLLHQVIQNDRSQFEEIAGIFASYQTLRSVTSSMKDKLWKNLQYIMRFLDRVPYQRNHRLGVELGVSLPTLSLIEANFRSDSERIRMEIVQNWLHGNANQDVSMRFLKQAVNTLANPLEKHCNVSKSTVVSAMAFATLAITVLCLNSRDPGFMFRDNYNSELRKELDQSKIPGITGSNKYIKHLPKLNQRVLGRENETSDIISHVENTNLNIMIVGKPGFGKSTLAIHAGEKLKGSGLDVFWVDIDEHFTDYTRIRDIKSFYDIMYEWSKLRNNKAKKSVLILDNYDKLLITDEKIKIFQEKFVKEMASYSDVRLVITTQIKMLNKGFHVIRADEISRASSVELLTVSASMMNLTDEQKHNIAEIVEDCPLALDIVVQILDSFQSNKNITNPIEYAIKRVNDSKAEKSVEEKEGWKKYNYLMDIAFEHLRRQAQCCGCCISGYSCSFSEQLFELTSKHIGVPCNGSNFQDCVHKLTQNSMLDTYVLDDDIMRYKMHTLIGRYFASVKSDHDCSTGYRQMFSLYFSTYCALPEFFNAKDLSQSSSTLALDYCHFQKLLQYIRSTGSQSKYEAAVLMIAYQRGEIKGVRDYQLLNEAVCECEDCVDYIISTIGNEAFGKIVMNVSAKVHDLNFLRCEFITDNFCSKALLRNPPGNHSTLKTMYNSEVIHIVCTCLLMKYYHVMGIVGILGTLPFLLLLKRLKVVPLLTEIDMITTIFTYMNFLPGVLKLYFGSDIEKIFLNVYGVGHGVGDAWLYTLLSQLLYEFFIMWFSGHFFQQREVLYSTSIRIKNLVMVSLCMCLPVAILQADMLGMYTFSAAKWNAGVLIILIGARRYIFDYVTKKISNGILLRLFFRLILGILSATSKFACKFLLFETSLQVQSVFIIGSVFYTVIIARFTALMFSYLDIL